ncbi:permeases of the major facilitator superfamily domain protein [Burkholderia pseudomallei TSV5]|nr:permeases of the major facilitator superfamily domain protein [Burkholderia pseudomallei TSV5]
MRALMQYHRTTCPMRAVTCPFGERSRIAPTRSACVAQHATRVEPRRPRPRNNERSAACRSPERKTPEARTRACRAKPSSSDTIAIPLHAKDKAHGLTAVGWFDETPPLARALSA